MSLQTITLAGGCFWCMEAVYEEVDGVVGVESGYANGHVPDPGYAAVCEGDTGHAEVVRVTFDPERIPLREVLEIFFTVHDKADRAHGGRVVTELMPLKSYWRAEDDHQHYFRNHPEQGYCAFVVAPKVEKFRKTFRARVRRAG